MRISDWSSDVCSSDLPYGGPMFFAHYSFCGLDPRGLKDRYADYWDLNQRHVQINRAHCIANPGRYKGYGESCWGLTASDDRSEEHTSELQSLMRISYAVFCLKKKNTTISHIHYAHNNN